MPERQLKILELITKAASDEKVESLLNALINDASFDEVAEIRVLLNDRLSWEKEPGVKYNYQKALEFLD